jgi:hypothetical protein
MAGFRPLIPLRIPSGWEVRFNNFVELPGDLGARERAAYLSQDLLSIRSTAPEGAPTAGWELDLGWHPDGDPAGVYRLTLIDPDGRPAARLESVYAEVARDAVAVCLNRVNEGAGPELIQRLLNDATQSLS